MYHRISTIAFLLLVFCLNAFAQEQDKSVYLEVFGPSNLIGVSYDARIKSGSNLGYRVGLGYMAGYTDNFFCNYESHHQNAITVPLELNYLIGKGKSKLEIGAGSNIGMYHVSGTVFKCDYVPKDDGLYEQINLRDEHYSETKFGYYMYGNVGYRHTAKNGFQFRCGVNPSFNFGDKHGLKKAVLYPYVSFGYAF